MGELKLEKLLTPTEVANLMGLSIRTIWTMSRQGRLKKVPNLGKTIRFRPEDVSCLINGSPIKQK